MNELRGLAAILLLVGTLLAIAPTAVEAMPITYDISFTLLVGSPLPASGRFTYDPTVPSFSDFHVIWMGVDFDLTAPANNPIIVDGNGCPGFTGPEASFALLNHSLVACDGFDSWHAQQVLGFLTPSQADFQFNDFSNPSPSVFGLIMIDRFIDFPPPVRPFAVAAGSWLLNAQAPVPAPGSLVLLLSALASLAWLRQR